MQVQLSSYSSDAVYWLGVDRDSGVVVRLRVGSGGWVGYSDVDYQGLVSVLEAARVEH